jgi:hypothetical protein
MGIPGLWKHLENAEAVEYNTLRAFSLEQFEKRRVDGARALRLGCDVAGWLVVRLRSL